MLGRAHDAEEAEPEAEGQHQVVVRERRHRIELARRRDDEFAPARIRGLQASVGDFLDWHAQREQYRAAYRAFFRDWDVLLAPITIQSAFEHIEMPWPPNEASSQLTMSVGGRIVPYDRQLVYPRLATLSGQPATAFRTGPTRSGLPIGLQAIGPYLEDRTPIGFTALLAQAFGGFRRPPGYD